MQRFFCPHLSESAAENILITDPGEIHHALHVLRLKPGESVELIDGKGVIACGPVVDLGKRVFDVRIQRRERVSPPVSTCVLACAVPRRSRFETVIEKAVELGVDVIVPLITARTENRPRRDKETRYQDVLLSACKQARRAWFPELHRVTMFSSAVETLAREDASVYLPWLEGERLAFRKALDQHFFLRNPRPSSVVFFIGPEGDFTREEAALLMAKGAIPVSLGPLVLRVETAALAVASAFLLS